MPEKYQSKLSHRKNGYRPRVRAQMERRALKLHTFLGPCCNADGQQGDEQQLQGEVPHFGRDVDPGGGSVFTPKAGERRARGWRVEVVYKLCYCTVGSVATEGQRDVQARSGGDVLGWGQAGSG
jgi:hypothetical protein